MRQSEFVRIPVNARDGHRFELSAYKITESGTSPLILILPAMGISAMHYQQLAGSLSENGYSILVADLRGLGSSSIRASRKSNFGYYDLVASDVQAMVVETKRRFPGRPLILMGHSLGGQLATMYAAMEPDGIDGLILVACGSLHYRNWSFPQNLKILFFSQLVRVIAFVFGYFPGKKLKFAGTEARTVMQDWSHLALTGRFEPVGSDVDFESSFSKARLPVLAISLEGDWFAPPKSLAALAGKLKNGQISFHHLQEETTLKRPLDHFNWVRHSQPVVDRINEWMPQVAVKSC